MVVGVAVGAGVRVGVAVAVAVGVGVGVGVAVGVAVGVGVSVTVGIGVGAGVGVGVRVGSEVAEAVAVATGVAAGASVGSRVGVDECGKVGLAAFVSGEVANASRSVPGELPSDVQAATRSNSINVAHIQRARPKLAVGNFNLLNSIFGLLQTKRRVFACVISAFLESRR